MVGTRVGPSFPDVDDDDDSVDIGPHLQWYLDWVLHGWFMYNYEGRHVLHELSEVYRKREIQFSMPLFLQAMWATVARCRDGLDIRTTGVWPPNATVLSCVCKQAWVAQGCQPGDQLFCVEALLNWGADPNLVSNRGNTVLMEVAGAGHVEMFKFFYQRIMKQHWTCDLEVVNDDGRNLWSIAGLAHVDAGAEELREHVNPEIKRMVEHLHEHGHIQGEGLATFSGAARGKRARVEDTLGDVHAVQAASSSSRCPAPSAGLTTPSGRGKRARLSQRADDEAQQQQQQQQQHLQVPAFKNKLATSQDRTCRGGYFWQQQEERKKDVPDVEAPSSSSRPPPPAIRVRVAPTTAPEAKGRKKGRRWSDVSLSDSDEVDLNAMA